MGLRATAYADARAILNDSAAGFGWPVKVTDPAGNTADLTGYAGDVAQTIDPDTGQAVTGRRAPLTLHLDDLEAAGLGIPRSVADESGDPWRIEYNDITLNHLVKYDILEAWPDRTLGVVTCWLGIYKDGV